MLRQILFIVLFASYTCTPLAAGQSGAAAAAAAGAGLAGSATSSGAAAAANAASGAGGASSAPVEVQIMVYGGLKQIARHIADDTAAALKEGTLTKAVFSGLAAGPDKTVLDTSEAGWKCTERTIGSVLLQDSTSSAQIALYRTFESYATKLSKDYTDLIAVLESGPTGQEAAKQKAELENLQQQLIVAQGKLKTLQQELETRSHALPPQIGPNFLQPSVGAANETAESLQSMINDVGGMTARINTATGTASGSTSGGSGSSQPVSLQYLSGIGGELTAAKSNMSYASSSVQALTQMFTTELGKDLCQYHIQMRTATTTLNLDDAAADITGKWEDLQKDIGKLTRLMSWLQRPTDKTVTKDPDGKPITKPPSVQDLISTSDGVVLGTSLSNAMGALLTWMTSGDQMGGIILTDILKGAQLSKDFDGKKFPALQVSIDAAGGNTRTNSFPLFNFFYLPRPSFNAGVVVTYELRDEANNFLAGDTKKVIYAYSKWKPEAFCMKEGVDSVDLDSGRPVKQNGKKCRND